MFDLKSLLTSVAADAMGLRRKRHQRALGFLGGIGAAGLPGALGRRGGRRGSFLNTSSLLGLAGLAVGAYQIFKDKSASSAAAPVVPGTTVVGGSGRAFGGFPETSAQGPERAEGLPPLPGPVAAASPDPSDMAMRAVRLMIAAARCDGNLGEEELGRLVSHARDAGLEEEMRREWQSPRPLAEICAGVTDPRQRRDLYVLAYAVLRADDEVSGAERVFLAGLASRLALSPDEAAGFERDTASQIDQMS